jgi:hypothetical protein
VPSFILFRRAIGALANISQVETMISSFLIPLQVCNFGTYCASWIGFCIYWRMFYQALADKEGRIHCSLNLNTETGKLLCLFGEWQMQYVIIFVVILIFSKAVCPVESLTSKTNLHWKKTSIKFVTRLWQKKETHYWWQTMVS